MPPKGLDDVALSTIDEPLWPGMFGVALPNMSTLEVGGMADQVRGLPVSRPPAADTLHEWAQGTLGLSWVGHPPTWAGGSSPEA